MAVINGHPKALRAVVRSEWAELGPVGRAVFIALVMSALVVVVLGVAIPWQVERHLIDSELETFDRIARGMAEEGFIPPDPDDPSSLAALDQAVRVRLLGSNTVRVKVWLPDGTIGYSDVPDLIGERFAPSDDRGEAFGGSPVAGMPDLSRPENFHERTLPPVHEFYVPVTGNAGSVVAVFEVYHLAEPITATVGSIRRYTWGSIAAGIGLLAVFTAVLIVTNGRALTRRRRLAENLFGELVRSQAEERTRIIGSLHDDIGQSLYRVHYGLEDLRSRIDPNSDMAQELDHLGALVGEVDGALRAELRLLRHGTGEEIGLGSALDELAEVTEMESDLSVAVRVEPDCSLSPTGRVALFRAAREAVTNVRKHADADSVDIRVYRDGKAIRLEVIDDGVGIAEEEGLGLTTTRERLEAIGGGLRIRTGRSGGARFEAWMPAEEHGEAV